MTSSTTIKYSIKFQLERLCAGLHGTMPAWRGHKVPMRSSHSNASPASVETLFAIPASGKN